MPFIMQQAKPVLCNSNNKITIDSCNKHCQDHNKLRAKTPSCKKQYTSIMQQAMPGSCQNTNKVIIFLKTFFPQMFWKNIQTCHATRNKSRIMIIRMDAIYKFSGFDNHNINNNKF